VTAKVAHESPSPLRLTRSGYCSSLAALLILFACQSLQNATAEGETRTISFHHIHTNEDLTITYKVNGRYDEKALAKIDMLLRDWRQDKTVRMDPHLIDLLWEVQREVSAKQPIWVVCGYRSPATNESLRTHSSGVAKFSQHMNGKAVDFYIPGVSLDQLRAAGLRAQRGGVGFYPTSGSPFVHLDTSNVRHWPRMPEAQLASVLAKGELSSRFASDPKGTRIAQGEIQHLRQRPTAVASVSAAGKDMDLEDEPDDVSRPSLPAPSKAASSPGYELASASATTSAKDVLKERGYWQGPPSAEQVEVRPTSNARITPAAPPRRAIATASASPAPWPLADRNQSEPPPNALSYASQPTPIATARPLPMGQLHSNPAGRKDTTVVAKHSGEHPGAPTPANDEQASAIRGKQLSSVVRVGDRFNDPWMRALIVSPSAQSFLGTTLFGPPDFRELGPYLHKPTSALAMAFSDDPHPGMASEQFSGSAVTFVSNVKFGTK
jgi:uncharacterized protein YcbK (DUF882 family)